MMKSDNKPLVVESYLFFEGRCEEALEFYRKALGAEVQAMMRFKDSPEPEHCAGMDLNKIMHATFRIGETTVMASDGRCTLKTDFQGFALAIAARNEDEGRKYFNALTEGGQVIMPLTKTFWSPLFGMVTDRFGITWMINVLP